jgi:hypothetical protein
MSAMTTKGNFTCSSRDLEWGTIMMVIEVKALLKKFLIFNILFFCNYENNDKSDNAVPVATARKTGKPRLGVSPPLCAPHLAGNPTQSLSVLARNYPSGCTCNQACRM